MQKNYPFIHLAARQLYIHPFRIEPVEGYEAPIHEETKEPLPFCCEYHINMYNNLNGWFSKFPNCCDFHKELSTDPHFKMELYEDLPTKIVYSLSLTGQLIRNKIGEEDWEKTIKDFIDHVVDSFGQPKLGIGRYLMLLKHEITKLNLLPEEHKEKRAILGEYVEQKLHPKKDVTPLSDDMNLLFSIFQKWVMALPDLSFLLPMKEKLKKSIPINLLLKDPCHNIYSDVVKFRPVTQKELVEELLSLTKMVLSIIDTKSLISKGIISNKEQHKIELELEHHRATQTKLVGDYSSKEKKYIKLFKKWLQNENEFFKRISPRFEKLQKQLNAPILPDTTATQKVTATNLEGLFREGCYEKIINFLKNEKYITIDQNGVMEWAKNEDLFIAIFWAIRKVQLPDERSILFTPIPSITKYQKKIFQEFQIENYSIEKFRKHNRHKYHVKDLIEDFQKQIEQLFIE